MFVIERLKANNFFSYPELDVDFAGKDLILVEAEPLADGSGYTKSNGFGKSAIAEAISYGLYGKLLRSQGVRVAPEEIILEGAKELSVELHLKKLEHDRKLVITRTLTIDGKKTFSVDVNGVKRDFDKKKDAESAFQEFIGLEFEMLMRRFLTPENTSFISLSPSQRFKFVSSLLTFNWDKIWVEMINKSKKIKEEIDLINNEISTLKVQEAKANGVVEMAKYKETVTANKIEQLNAKLDELGTNANKVADALKLLEEKEATVSKETKDKEIEYNKGKSLLTKLADRVKMLKEMDPVTEYSEKFKGIELLCPECSNVLSPETIIQQLAKKDLDKREVSIQELLEAIELANKGFVELKNEYNKKNAEYIEIRDKLSSYRADLRIKKNEINSILKERNGLEANDKVANGASVEEAKKQLQTIKKQLSELNKTLKQKETLYAAYQIVKNGSQTTSPARLSSMAKILPALAAGVSNVTTHMFGRPINVNFKTDDKQLEVICPELHIPTMSTGERRSFDIAIAYTIQDLALKSSRNMIGFFIGDEIFDGLDGERIQAAVELIKSLPIPQILLITHRETAKSLVEISSKDVYVLRVTKSGKYSRAAFIDINELKSSDVDVEIDVEKTDPQKRIN